ncbi:MAG: glycosyltransferase [Ilumatobacteraceae bacterium]
MDATGTIAPPVVAVMVVHQPGDWFDEVLDGLARQDYGNLKVLFLVTGEPDDLPSRIRSRVANSFVRAVGGNPGFGRAANEVLRLVEGDNGFFCFLHDDVALQPSAIRLLVEELYRSNAGIVGPKLVTWDDPQILQHVGLAVDRFGEIDPIIEPGEYDQEQHDAVRDVFAVPTACLLVRADLFRTIGGFDPTIEYHGDDVDLCWRAHLSGARVVVVPAASARHREALGERRPDLPVAGPRARARMRSVATLTGSRRLMLLSVQLVLMTLAQSVYLAVRGRFRDAAAGLGALLGMVPLSPSYFARRRAIAPLRQVPDTEVAGLQLRGSARVTAFMRARDSRPVDPEMGNERRWRESAGSAPVIAWLVVLILFLVGSRKVIADGVPRFGEFLRFQPSPATMLGDYLSGWSGHGLGSATAVPTAIGVTAAMSVGTLFHTGLLHTLAVIGLLLAGYLGAWRLATIFPTVRARITVLVVYAAVPLGAELLSAGRWSALVGYALAPWVVHLLRRFAGLDSRWVDEDGDGEALRDLPVRKRVRIGAQLALLASLSFAFAPSSMVLLVGIGLVLAVATLVSRGSAVAAGMMALGSLGALVVALIVNLPWSATFFGKGGWTAIVGVPPTTSRSLGVRTLAEFDLGSVRFTALALALFIPVFAAPLVSRSWRFVWSVRAAALVTVFGALAILDDRGALPFRLPEAGVMLVPVAVGIAIAAGCVVAAFDVDVLAGHFGWKQPLAVLSMAAMVVGVIPGVLATADGRWHMPSRTLQDVLVQFPTDPDTGDYRILWLGDPAAMPVAAWAYQPGVGYAITDDGPLWLDERYAGVPSDVEQEVADAVRQMAGGFTLRGGRLLAQYGIRYVVVPLADGFNGTISAPLAAPEGLADVLDDQLDLSPPLTRPPNYLVYENTAYTPTRSVLTAAGATASQQAGGEAVAQADLRGSTPWAVGAPDRGDATGPLPVGTLHVGVPFDPDWHLTVDGTEVPARRAFGSTLAYDTPTAGNGVLSYDTSIVRWLWVAFQVLAIGGLLAAASRARSGYLLPRRRLAVTLADETPVADLTAPFDPPVVPAQRADDPDALHFREDGPS